VSGADHMLSEKSHWSRLTA